MNSKLQVGITDLETKYPKIAAEWDYTENEKTPRDYFYGSSYKAHWICATCGRKWQATIRQRTKKGSICPDCAKKKRAHQRHLNALQKNGHLDDPLLLQEWDYQKNERPPEDYTRASNEVVHWIWSKEKHHYQSKISNRSIRKDGCPVCSNKIIVPGINDLKTTHPHLAAEWDYERNDSLTPEMVSYGHGKKVWWICPNGHPSYQATPNHRSNENSGCPKCYAGRQTSFAEQAVFFYVKQLYPDAINRYKDIFDNGMELDIYIPSIQLGIEYDGEAWHKDKHLEREEYKYNACIKHGIRLLRLKEERVSEHHRYTADDFLHIEKMHTHRQLEQAIRLLLSKLDSASTFWTRKNPSQVYSLIDVNLARDEHAIRKYMTDLGKDSLAFKFPELAREWHPTKNAPLTPAHVKPMSDISVWWICPDCHNEYKATIGHRVSGTGCPLCSILKNAIKNSKAIEMVDPTTNTTIKTFRSLSEASRQTGINDSNISMVCKGQRKKAGGYSWRYLKGE